MLFLPKNAHHCVSRESIVTSNESHTLGPVPHPVCASVCVPMTCSVGMLFLPNDDALEAQAKSIIDEVVSAEGLKVLGYRQVPVDHAVVGRFAKATQPRIWQVCFC